MSPVANSSPTLDGFSQFEKNHMRSELFPSIGKTKVQYSNGTVHHIHTCGNSAYRVVDAHTDSAHCVYIDYSFTNIGTSHPEIATLYLPQLTLNGTCVYQAFKIMIRNETVFSRTDLIDRIMAVFHGTTLQSQYLNCIAVHTTLATLHDSLWHESNECRVPLVLPLCCNPPSKIHPPCKSLFVWPSTLYLPNIYRFPEEHYYLTPLLLLYNRHSTAYQSFWLVAFFSVDSVSLVEFLSPPPDFRSNHVLWPPVRVLQSNLQVGPEVPGMYGFRNSHTTIVTRSEAGESVEWVIKCVAYGGNDIILDVDGVYYLKGRLLALNTKEIQKFYYEPDYQLLANTSENLVCNLANAVSVTGLGIIITRTSEVLEPGKENVSLIVKHSDYNPDTQSQDSFDVEYRALWSKLMEKLQPLMTVGREVMLTGHIVGRNESQQMWIVQVTGVSVTSGHEPNPPTTPVDGTATRTTPRGRHRAKMVFPEGNNTPVSQQTADSGHPVSPEESVEGSKGKGKAPSKVVSSRPSSKRNRETGPEGDS
ncbi:hypothetical protein DFH28DRAFT_1126691 [Melampsora americana]|nr:hypothetical protein DFH28DRAFT_1126691 [Melampsora americana]